MEILFLRSGCNVKQRNLEWVWVLEAGSFSTEAPPQFFYPTIHILHELLVSSSLSFSQFPLLSYLTCTSDSSWLLPLLLISTQILNTAPRANQNSCLLSHPCLTQGALAPSGISVEETPRCFICCAQESSTCTTIYAGRLDRGDGGTGGVEVAKAPSSLTVKGPGTNHPQQ